MSGQEERKSPTSEKHVFIKQKQSPDLKGGERTEESRVSDGITNGKETKMDNPGEKENALGGSKTELGEQGEARTTAGATELGDSGADANNPTTRNLTNQNEENTGESYTEQTTYQETTRIQTTTTVEKTTVEEVVEEVVEEENAEDGDEDPELRTSVTLKTSEQNDETNRKGGATEGGTAQEKRNEEQFKSTDATKDDQTRQESGSKIVSGYDKQADFEVGAQSKQQKSTESSAKMKTRREQEQKETGQDAHKKTEPITSDPEDFRQNMSSTGGEAFSSETKKLLEASKRVLIVSEQKDKSFVVRVKAPQQVYAYQVGAKAINRFRRVTTDGNAQSSSKTNDRNLEAFAVSSQVEGITREESYNVELRGCPYTPVSDVRGICFNQQPVPYLLPYAPGSTNCGPVEDLQNANR